MADTDPGFAVPPEAVVPPVGTAPPPVNDEGNSFTALRDDVGALVDDARNYVEAELAYQKTRATLAGKHSARALGFFGLALVLLHIALIALAVGVVIALAPYVTIWGAIAIVVGVMLLGVVILLRLALRDSKVVGAMFDDGEPG
ncbi:phage holin family protein [Porphyrobacter sp. YT40]|uniref:phage holin family protein n=1 Tax=Porphyrobacter sp. YT40 TaxID=2547601 RepID=UPI00114158BA|nr:phage holin family protein [Porphyrobacter sp. YT40]QDH35030.1 phage holin family protein [Porphyrobacter sp. YT40]